MNSIFYSVITLLLLTCGVLLLMRSANKNRHAENGHSENQPEMLSKEEGEDHFSVLMNSITPVWYWRVNHEYIDFIHSTIKRMTMVELNETPGLFDAQRRCSDLNSAVYKYYDNIKKRCLSGEKVPHADLDVLNLRQCFREFSLEAYPALVALVWPEYQRPEIKAEEVGRGLFGPYYVPGRLTLPPGTMLHTAICQMRPATGSAYRPRRAYRSAPVLRC